MNTENLYTVRKVVRFTHTDPAGYVFFPRYFEMLQATVEDWFTHALKVSYADFILARNLGLPTAKIECVFERPCRLGEIIDLSVTLERIGTSSIEVEFRGAVAGEERLRARSVLVVISMDDGRPRPIDKELRARLNAYKEGTWTQPA